MLKRIPRTICFMLLCSFLFNSCKKEKKEIVLEYPYLFFNNMEIDWYNVDTFVERETFDFPTSLDGELARNNTSKEKITSAKLVLMRIQVPDYAIGDTSKYGSLHDIAEIKLDIKKDGVGQQMVAKKFIPDAFTKAINMDLEFVEAKEYLKRDNFRLVIKYKKRRPILHEIPLIISIKFIITADPL